MLRRNIAAFDVTTLKGLSARDILARLMHVIAPNTGECTIPGFQSTYPQGSKFYRAIAVPEAETTLPLSVMARASDCWEPSPDKAGTGPFHHEGAPVLYAAPGDPDTAVLEARLGENGQFCLISFTATRDVPCALITATQEPAGYHGEERDKIMHFYRFLEDRLFRPAMEGDGDLDAACVTVAEAWFMLEGHAAWAYRSRDRAHKACVAFYYGQAGAYLALDGAMVCDTAAFKAGQGGVRCAVGFDAETGAARYHAVGSAEQKRLFPDLSAAP